MAHPLIIDRTWDGASIGDGERVGITLELPGDPGATADRRGALVLAVDAPLHRDPPPKAEPGPTPGLWEHEVVELFLYRADGADEDGTVRYLELELGPHGHWLAWSFHGVRRRVGSLPARAQVERDEAARRWRGELEIASRDLPDWLRTAARSDLLANAFAVHGLGAARRFLAWRPSGAERPDFHQPQSAAPLAGE
ncbi:MAG: hypothetical protein DWQ36_22390 [Acidobacteria bacterium]|nr:MAG: hypothetical protein DWQ30_25690 [Acidobacteriota bacterium]REK00570.1 MAG: hypothetical protein DWQ36_22390 [Acidobacteriota bacterium]